MRALLGAGESLYAAAWEWRRRAYARGWRVPQAVGARVVSVGNLSVGGAGKTTLTLHLVRLARERGISAAVVARDYRRGPGGAGDERLLYEQAFSAAAGSSTTERGSSRKGIPPASPMRAAGVYSGTSKRALAAAAAGAGHRLVVVDDGFSTWGLARDLDLVLLDSQDLWGGGHLLPRGRLREPRRALQRAGAVIVTRLGPREDPAPLLAEVGPYAPAALLAAARHRVRGVRSLDGGPPAAAGRVWILTATGNPGAVERSANEAGLEVAGRSAYRDHHWFREEEIARERRRAREARSALLLTAKDAVRWPRGLPAEGALVLEVDWEWVCGGREVEARVLEGLEAG